MSIYCLKCHRALKNPASIQHGMGPVCFAKEQAKNRFNEQGMPRANYQVIEETADHVKILDVGPWDQFSTITNAAESVVIEMFPQLLGRRLLYVDSSGDTDELLVNAEGRFGGFKVLPRNN